jgi:hypothetical protein
MRKVWKLRARLLAVAFVAAAPCLAAGQARQRVIEYDWKAPERPAPLLTESAAESVYAFETGAVAVELVGITAAGLSVGVGGPFEADDDWMKELKVRLRNVSGKNISGATLHLSLPEASYAGGVLQLSLAYQPGGEKTAGATALAPGDEFDLTLTPAEHERQRRRAAKLSGLKSVGRLGLGFLVVAFEDGTQWYCQMAGIN